MPQERQRSILIIEDNPDIVDIVAYNARKEGFLFSSAVDGKEGIEKALALKPDLILLDLMLPRIDGFEVCRTLRERPETKHTPIVMLTAKGGEADIVRGLTDGADDYVVKPFSPKELMARVSAVLRRRGRESSETQSVLCNGNLTIDSDKHEVRLSGRQIRLTLSEFKLLRVLAASPGRVFTRDQLIEKVGGPNLSIIDRNIDVHVAALRKKLGSRGEAIITIRGVGYRFGE